MAYTYENLPVLSKVKIGDVVYYLKDADVRKILNTYGSAVTYNVETTFNKDSDNLATSKAVATFLENAITGLSGAMHFAGIKKELPASANNGEVVIVGTAEYVWSDDKSGGPGWILIGDEGVYATISGVEAAYVKKTLTIAGINLEDAITADELKTALGLKALAYKDSATGTVAGQTISGIKATGNSSGSIDVALTQTATAATLSHEDYTPAGDVTGTVVAAGSVSIAKDAENGTQISGSVSAPNITVTPAIDTIKKVTSVGTLPTKAADTFVANGDDQFSAGSQAAWSASVDDNETLSFSFTANTLPTFTQGAKASFTEGAFTQGTLPELAEAGTTVVTGITSAVADAPIFTGDKFAASFTGASADIAATFAGKKKSFVSGVTYDKAGVDTANTKFNAAAIELEVGDITVTSKSVTVQ